MTFLSPADKHQCVSDYCPSAQISGERRDHTIFRSCVKLGRNGTSQCDCVLGIHMWKSRGSWSRGEGKSPMTSWQSADLRSFPESVCTAAALCCPHKSAHTYVLWNSSLRKKKKKTFTHSLNRFPPASKGVHYTGIQSSEPPHWSVTTDCVPFLYKNKTKDISSLKREHQCYCCSGQERKWNIKSNVVVVLGSWEPWRSQDSLSMAPLQKLHFISCTVTANPELERPLQVIHLHCFSCDVPSVSVSRRLNTLQEPEPQMWQPDRVASSPFHPGR